MKTLLLTLLILVTFVTTATAQVKSSRAELDALIDREGKTSPPWFKDTRLDYPIARPVVAQGAAAGWLE